MNHIWPILLACWLLVLTGCEPSDLASRTDVLPIGAQQVEALGNGWYTFELEVNGIQRQFLFHRYTSHQESREAITELMPR